MEEESIDWVYVPLDIKQVIMEWQSSSMVHRWYQPDNWPASIDENFAEHQHGQQ